MKRGLLGLMVLIVVLALGMQAFGAAGYRSGIVLFPQSGYSNTDTTWATTVGDKANWFDWRAYASQYKATGWGLCVTVKAQDADIDSIEVMTAGSGNKVTLAVIDSSEITGSTLGSALHKIYTTDSTYGFYPYAITYARVFGDAAGTATQTITLTVTWWAFNKFTGAWVDWKQYDLPVSFVE